MLQPLIYAHTKVSGERLITTHVMQQTSKPTIGILQTFEFHRHV